MGLIDVLTATQRRPVILPHAFLKLASLFFFFALCNRAGTGLKQAPRIPCPTGCAHFGCAVYPLDSPDGPAPPPQGHAMTVRTLIFGVFNHLIALLYEDSRTFYYVQPVTARLCTDCHGPDSTHTVTASTSSLRLLPYLRERFADQHCFTARTRRCAGVLCQRSSWPRPRTYCP